MCSKKFEYLKKFQIFFRQVLTSKDNTVMTELPQSHDFINPYSIYKPN